MTIFTIVIEGDDAEKVVADIISNCEYDKADVAVWVSDDDYAESGASTLAYYSLPTDTDDSTEGGEN